ncbi:DNA polymerase Y family protein [Piscinibacter sp. XHJ-5]|uniref:Y-family DNA polymerase n=1 Tax=Piscinibacter sp. XHJ-5 TaxID=3037797 RepID=UPI002452E928|nr:DNA polymerase Y family protein [Piscinibacter sp. XHJ-5]
MLWVALHLPLLSLESFATTLAPLGEEAGPAPIALVDAHHIVSANDSAQSLGVKSGLKRATALALAPHIVLGQADALRDLQAITAVAHAALAFTPSVTLEPAGDPQAAPHTVLLEVHSSLRYFGGKRPLLRRLQSQLRPLGHRVHCATAPTAQGAALLARLPEAPEGRHAVDLAALNRLLDAAPVWLLGPGREHWEALQGMGLHCLSDLQGLPRSGLARRFGEPLLAEIDRARGLQPDPRTWISLPDRFESRLELFARADTTEQVLHGAAILLARLVAWAGAQHAQVRRFTLHMQHEPRHRRDTATPADSTLEIALAEPSRDIAHLLVLLRERLARLQLAAPTLELRLSCADIARGAPPNGELFPTAKSEREGLIRLVERLQARLGHEQVQRLSLVEDHRPECATAVERAEASLRASRVARPPPPAGPRRPVWLLAEPELLHERQLRPLLEGQPLQLLCGPERIETGWWDAALAERDYFIAQAGDGALVWIYRARLPSAGQGWFLQGRFG